MMTSGVRVKALVHLDGRDPPRTMAAEAMADGAIIYGAAALEPDTG